MPGWKKMFWERLISPVSLTASLRSQKMAPEINPGKTLLVSNPADPPAVLLLALKQMAMLIKADPEGELHVSRHFGVRHPSIQETVELPAEKKLSAFLTLEKYKTVVFISPEPSSGKTMAAYLAGVKNRVGFARGNSKSFLNHRISYLEGKVHYAFQIKNLLENFSGQSLEPGYPEWQRYPEVQEDIFAFLSQCRLFRFAVISASPEDLEEAHAIRKYLSLPSVIVSPQLREDIPCMFPFPVWSHVMQLVAESRLVVSLGGYAGHLAASLGIPVVSLYRQERDSMFVPFAPGSRQIPFVSVDQSGEEIAAAVLRLL